MSTSRADTLNARAYSVPVRVVLVLESRICHSCKVNCILKRLMDVCIAFSMIYSGAHCYCFTVLLVQKRRWSCMCSMLCSARHTTVLSESVCLVCDGIQCKGWVGMYSLLSGVQQSDGQREEAVSLSAGSGPDAAVPCAWW